MIILSHINFIFFIWQWRQVHHFEIHQKLHGGFGFSFGQSTVMRRAWDLTPSFFLQKLGCITRANTWILLFYSVTTGYIHRCTYPSRSCSRTRVQRFLGSHLGVLGWDAPLIFTHQLFIVSKRFWIFWELFSLQKHFFREEGMAGTRKRVRKYNVWLVIFNWGLVA